jgi:hypothetical protein
MTDISIACFCEIAVLKPWLEGCNHLVERAVGQGAQEVNDLRGRCWGLILTLNWPPTYSTVATPGTELNLSLCLIKHHAIKTDGEVKMLS